MTTRQHMTNKIQGVILLVPEALMHDKLVSVAHLKKWHIFAVASDAIAQRHRDAWIFARGVMSGSADMHQWCIFAEYHIVGVKGGDLAAIHLPYRTPKSVVWVNLLPSGPVVGPYYKKTPYVFSRRQALIYNGKMVNGGVGLYAVPGSWLLHAEHIWSKYDAKEDKEHVPMGNCLLLTRSLKNTTGLVDLQQPQLGCAQLGCARLSSSSSSQLQVDAVVLWVDADDHAWRESYNAYAPPGLKKPDAARYGPGSDCLKMCLRSLHVNVPFLRHVYIVTADQTPSWFVPNAGATIVSHRDLFGSDGRLPTFNSSAIESVVYRIPGLSRYFLYSNDDMFVLRKTSRDDWFFPDGVAKVFPHHEGKVFPSVLGGGGKVRPFDIQLLVANVCLATCKNHNNKKEEEDDAQRPAHQVSIHHVDAYAQLERSIPAVLAETRTSRFRTSHAFHPHINQYVAQEVMCRLGLARRDVLSRKDNVYLDLGKKRLDHLEKRFMQRGFNRSAPMLFCANDHEVYRQRSLRLTCEILRAMLPISAPWEKDKQEQSL